MANIIRHRRSLVGGLAPVAPDLTLGELALNCVDGRIFTLLTSGAVIDIAIPTEVDGGRITVPSIVFPAGYNSANYGSSANWNTSLDGNVLAVGTSGGQSAYGTFDQSGNVFEYVQSGLLRGGSFASAVLDLNSISAAKSTVDPSERGFRIATKTNPYELANFVSIGDVSNQPNFNGLGSVTYSYGINKYSVTNAEYAAFLNAIPNGDEFYLPVTGNDSRWYSSRGIAREGTSSEPVFTVVADMSDKPVNYISLEYAARYCNWLHNNYGSTETGAYDLTDYVAGQPLPTRATNAKYFIPTESEWYKAAYYKGSGAQSGYWRYATQSDEIPAAVCATNIGVGTITLCAGDRLITSSGQFLLTSRNDNLITAQDL